MKPHLNSLDLELGLELHQITKFHILINISPTNNIQDFFTKIFELISEKLTKILQNLYYYSKSNKQTNAGEITTSLVRVVILALMLYWLIDCQLMH